MVKLSNHISRVVVWLMIAGLLVSALAACAATTSSLITSGVGEEQAASKEMIVIKATSEYLRFIFVSSLI